MEEKDNLSLWNKVQETNPNYTKKANVKGNKITSIAPQYQILHATEQFGVYGKAWGFKSLEFDYTLKEMGMVVFNAVFFYPDGEFPIVNSVQLYKDGAMTKIDDDFAKKVETDTLTKALSKLGFNADIFMGKFDDTKYFDEMVDKYKEPLPPIEITPIDDAQLDKYINWIAIKQKDNSGNLIDLEYMRARHTLSSTQEAALLLTGLESNTD